MLSLKKIDYVMVIFRNYRLLETQREIFSNFNKDDYRLIIVDNTPDSEKQNIIPQKNETIYYRNSVNEFDGISHGLALDLGVSCVDTDVVCVIDSDFFIMNNNIHNYIKEKFSDGYESVGAEFGSYHFRSRHPGYLFDNMPILFCNYLKTQIATSMSWVVTREEVNFETSFIESGWRFRDYFLKNKTKTLGWKIKNYLSDGQHIYVNEKNELMGYHYMAASGARVAFDYYSEYKKVKDEYGI